LRRRYITKPPNAKEDYVVSTIRGDLVFKYLNRDLSEYMYEDLSGWINPEYIKSIPRLVSEERTRILEEYMVEIEEGKRDRRSVLDDIYNEIRGLAQPINDAIHNVIRGGQEAPITDCIRNAYVIVGSSGGVEHEDGGDTR